MARRGRPPGGDSEATRRSIIDAARFVFATRGFAATTVAALAEAVELAPSAIYHYYGGKSELYEAVFAATSDGIWSDLDESAHAQKSLVEALDSMINNAMLASETRPYFSDFLSLVPMEAHLHPEFAHLLDVRSKYQDATFSALARLGIETGELAGFTLHEGTEVLRSLIMGWFFEQQFRGSEIPGSRQALQSLFRALADR